MTYPVIGDTVLVWRISGVDDVLGDTRPVKGTLTADDGTTVTVQVRGAAMEYKAVQVRVEKA